MKISIGSSVNWRVPRLALDDLCDSFDYVGTGVGNLVHDGWIHPHPIGHRRGGASDQSRSGTKSLVAISAL